MICLEPANSKLTSTSVCSGDEQQGISHRVRVEGRLWRDVHQLRSQHLVTEEAVQLGKHGISALVKAGGILLIV